MRDLAVLSITDGAPPELRPLPLAASGALKVGQSVYALGARYGEGKSLSAGEKGLNKQPC
jgi:S1-C subfamily serine protease